MPTKITRSAQPARKPHKPTFPIRKPTLVAAAQADQVSPINAAKVRPHPTRHGWLMWGIMALCAIMGILFRDAIVAGASYVILQHHERQLAVIGADICTRPLLTVVEAPCTSGDLACFTEPQQALLKRYEEQARGHNLWQAESCLPLM